MDKNKTYTTTIDEDGVLVFPEELIDSLDWREGDEIRWVISNDNCVIMINITATLRNEKFSQSTDNGQADQGQPAS